MHFIRKRKSRLLTMGEHFKVGCTFQAQKFRNDGTITYQGPTFHNLVLDTGLDAMADYAYRLANKEAAGNGVASWINVGEGSATPAVTQTGLSSYLASSGSTYGSISGGYEATSPRHKWQEAVFEFAVGSCVGNLTEVGLSSGENTGYFNRQLFKDEEGSPTTITVLSDEGLRIATKLFLYGDMEPGDTEAGSFLLNGTDTIDFTREMTSNTSWLADSEEGSMARIGYARTDLAQITSSNTDFSGTKADSANAVSYSTGSYYRDCEYVWDPATFVGDIASICFQLMPYYYANPYSAFRLSPVISITDTDEFRVTLRRSWGRYAA